MAASPRFVPEGVIPATLLALTADLEIDEGESRRHLRHCIDVDGVTAVTVNGHASEVHACTFDEQRRILDFSLEEVGGKIPVVSGVFADGSLEAARIARMTQQSGASALLVFPSQCFGMGAQLRREMPISHFKRIADASDLPIICFQYPLATFGYPFETLLLMCEQIPSICAIKDWTAEPASHERNIRTFQSLSRPVSVLTTQSSWLMSSLTMGAKGLLSGAGSVVADLQVALFRAVQGGDLLTARKINDRLFPLQQAFYAPPFVDMHNRMKEALVLLGRLKHAYVRPPLVKIPSEEIVRLHLALSAARINIDGAEPDN